MITASEISRKCPRFGNYTPAGEETGPVPANCGGVAMSTEYSPDGQRQHPICVLGELCALAVDFQPTVEG